jgi:hypothetical protein
MELDVDLDMDMDMDMDVDLDTRLANEHRHCFQSVAMWKFFLMLLMLA